MGLGFELLTGVDHHRDWLLTGRMAVGEPLHGVHQLSGLALDDRRVDPRDVCLQLYDGILPRGQSPEIVRSTVPVFLFRAAGAEPKVQPNEPDLLFGSVCRKFDPQVTLSNNDATASSIVRASL